MYLPVKDLRQGKEERTKVFRRGTTVGTINAKNGKKEKHLRGATDNEEGCKCGEEKRHD